MTVRRLRVGIRGYSRVVLTISKRLFSFRCFAQRFSDLLPQDVIRIIAIRKTLRVRQISGYRPAASTIASRIAVFLCSAFLFAAVIERYHCSARCIGEARDDLGRDGLSLNCARSLGMRCGPNTLLKAFERKLTFL
jgi:hypothetical protein